MTALNTKLIRCKQNTKDFYKCFSSIKSSFPWYEFYSIATVFQICHADDTIICPCAVGQKKKYLFQCKLLYRNETGTNQHGLFVIYFSLML